MGSGGSKTSTQESTPWEGQQPYLKDLFSQAQGLFDQGPQQYFPGQTVAPFSPQTQMGMDATMQRAQGGSPQQDAMGNYLTGAMGQQNMDPSQIFGRAMGAANGIPQGQNMMSQAGQAGMSLGQPNPFVGSAGNALQGMTGFGGLASAQQFAGNPAMGALPASQQYVNDTLGGGQGYGDWTQQVLGGMPGVNPQNVGADQVGYDKVGYDNVAGRDVSAERLGDQFGAGGAAANQLAQTAQGSFLGSNPFLDQMFDTASSRAGEAFNEQTMPAIAAQFGSAGRTGSGIHQQMAQNAQRQFGRDLQGMAADIYAPEYGQERSRQLQAASSLGGLNLQGQGLGLQQGQSNQATGLQAGMANQNMDMTGQLANQAAGIQTGGMNQAAGIQTGGMNQDANLRAGMANQQAGLQGDTQNQNAYLRAMGLGGDQFGGQQQRQQGAAQLGGDLFGQYNQAQLGRNQLASSQYLGERGLGQEGAGMLGDLGINQGNLALGGYGLGGQMGQGMGQLGMQGLGQMSDMYGQISQDQYRAGTLAPSFRDMQYGDANQMMQVGASVEDQAQRYMAANQDRWNFNQQAPWQNMNNYASTIYGLPGGYGTQTSTQPGGSRLQGAAGGAATGAALGPWGALAGGVLGAFM